MNDWFPVHLLPVSVFAMLFDYAFAKDLTAKDPNNNAKDRSTQDSVAKFREGYQAIVDHASNIKKIEAPEPKVYQTMWRNYILKNLLYPHDTLFVDFPGPEEDVDSEYLFMWAGFVKPGKHRSFLYVPNEDAWYKRDFYVDERENDDLPNFADYNNAFDGEG